MSDIESMQHCGRRRKLSAFIYRDWWALRARFHFDLRVLCKGVPTTLPAAPEKPFLRADLAAPSPTGPLPHHAEPKTAASSDDKEPRSTEPLTDPGPEGG